MADTGSVTNRYDKLRLGRRLKRNLENEKSKQECTQMGKHGAWRRMGNACLTARQTAVQVALAKCSGPSHQYRHGEKKRRVEVDSVCPGRRSQLHLHVFHAEGVETVMCAVAAAGALMHRGYLDFAPVQAMLNGGSRAQKNDNEREQECRKYVSESFHESLLQMDMVYEFGCKGTKFSRNARCLAC